MRDDLAVKRTGQRGLPAGPVPTPPAHAAAFCEPSADPDRRSRPRPHEDLYFSERAVLLRSRLLPARRGGGGRELAWFPPSQIEITFSIKLSAEVGAIISKVGGEAALGVRLLWGDPG
jgi:hypothetical protein